MWNVNITHDSALLGCRWWLFQLENYRSHPWYIFACSTWFRIEITQFGDSLPFCAWFDSVSLCDKLLLGIPGTIKLYTCNWLVGTWILCHSPWSGSRVNKINSHIKSLTVYPYLLNLWLCGNYNFNLYRQEKKTRKTKNGAKKSVFRIAHHFLLPYSCLLYTSRCV